MLESIDSRDEFDGTELRRDRRLSFRRPTGVKKAGHNRVIESAAGPGDD